MELELFKDGMGSWHLEVSRLFLFSVVVEKALSFHGVCLPFGSDGAIEGDIEFLLCRYVG